MCSLFNVNSSISLCESVWCHYVCLSCILMYTCVLCKCLVSSIYVCPVLQCLDRKGCISFMCFYMSSVSHFGFVSLILGAKKWHIFHFSPSFPSQISSFTIIASFWHAHWFTHSHKHVKELVCCCILCDITAHRQLISDSYLPAEEICAFYWSRQ